jgi:hypothetical protein
MLLVSLQGSTQRLQPALILCCRRERRIGSSGGFGKGMPSCVPHVYTTVYENQSQITLTGGDVFAGMLDPGRAE